MIIIIFQFIFGVAFFEFELFSQSLCKFIYFVFLLGYNYASLQTVNIKYIKYV